MGKHKDLSASDTGKNCDSYTTESEPLRNSRSCVVFLVCSGYYLQKQAKKEQPVHRVRSYRRAPVAQIAEIFDAS